MAAKHDGPKAIAFDYGGVLAHFMDEETMCHMAGTAGLSTEAFVEPYWRLRPAFDNGDLGLSDYWNAVLDAGGSAVDRMHAATVLAELDTIGWSRMNAAVIRWALELLAAGYRCFIVSNMSVSAYEVLIARRSWARHFEAHIISGQLGVNKPDRAIFAEAVARTRLAPGEVLFLDDSERNIVAAREFGMAALQVSTAARLEADLRREFPSVPCGSLVCGVNG